MIGAEYLVLHPGNYKGQSVEQAIAAFVLYNDEGDDRRNLETLKKLCPRNRTTTTPSN